MIISWYWLKIVQRFVSIQDFDCYGNQNKKNFKNLVRNHWTNFSIIWQKCSFGVLPRLIKPSWVIKKHGCQGAGLIFPTYLYGKLKKSCQKHCWPMSIWYGRNVSLVTLSQDCSSHNDWTKNMAARGQGFFSLYIYIENFKIFLSETTGSISILLVWN